MPRFPRPVFLAVTLALPPLVGCASPAPPPLTPDSSQSGAAPAPPPVVTRAAEVGGSQRLAEGLASKIARVTVYSDRALVTREASLSLTTEPAVHRLEHLPGWVDEGSVRASTSAGKIVDVSVERHFLAQSSDEGFRKVEDEHRALLGELQGVDDELEILQAQKGHVESIQVFSLEKLSTDAATRDIKVDTYGQVIDFVSRSLRQTADARRAAVLRREQLARQVQASQKNLDELRHLTTLEETAVVVTVQASAPGPARLTVTYATPGATWEPLHELRASSSAPAVAELTSFAVVTQTTGEDWSHADLSFSTQSAADTERIPELRMLALGETQHVSRSVTHRATSFSVAREKYAEQNLHWNRMNQAPRHAAELKRFEEAYSSNLAYFEAVQSKTVQIFQGLQDRGTTAHFVATDPAIVRSDGRPIRLRIGHSRLQAEPRIVAAPEESLNAALTLRMVNKGAQPLLPGAVARYRDGAFLGMTDVGFVASGEEFPLFLSVADHVKLTRALDKKKSSLVRLARNRMQLSFVTTVQNLSDAPVALVLAERVPVSENSDIRVSDVRITPAERPDAEGIVRWALSLAPREEKQIRISYQVDYPPELVLDVKRKRHSPGAPSPSPTHDFEDRLPHLEQMF